MKFGVLITLLAFGAGNLFGQESWDLEKCIQYALDNNIQIKQSELSSEINKQTMVNSKGNLLPDLNGFAANNWNFGQRIDPFTNQFANTSVRSNQFSLSSNTNLFSGFRQLNTVKRDEYNYEASKYAVDQQRNDITLAVANAYLVILFNQELLEIAEAQLNITSQQVERTEKLVNAGTLPQGALYDIQAQQATEEVNVVNMENQLALSALNLRQLLQVDSETTFDIVQPEVELKEEMLQLETRPESIYGLASTTLPRMKRAEYGLLAAEKDLSIARSTRSPSLNLNASYGTGYSGAAREVLGITPDGEQIIGFTDITGESVVAPTFSTETRVIPFTNQLEDNLNRSIGFSLTVPIFNGFTSKTAISQAKLSAEIARYNYELEGNQLRQDIERAYTDALGALKQYRAMEKSVTATTESFTYAEQRFNVGLINAVEYNDSKNRMTRAKSDLLRARYDFIFKTKVLDFYMGKPLTLK